MKKLWCLLAVLTLTFSLSGCGVTISEEENRIIAEYAADLLLKYDKNYQSSFIESEPDPTSEEEPSTEAASEKSDPASTETEKNTEASTEAAVSEITDIAEVLGLEGVSISFNQCMFLDHYPSDEQDASYVSLEADAGYKLVVVEFNIINQTEQDMEIDLLRETVEYQLVMNDSKEAKPMLTILTNDLGTLKYTVPAGETQPAVLVFQMAEGMIEQIESLKIRATYKNEEYMLHIQ